MNIMGLAIGLAIAVILVILLILGFGAIGCHNRIVRLNVKCDEAYATMDVYLKKRFDLIPNLVSVVKGYAQHEANTLENVIRMRQDAKDPAQQIMHENEVVKSMGNILALAENYPELKANASFMQLSEELRDAEEDIANARKYYNGVIRQYNTAIRTFPSNVFANMLGYHARPMYEVDAVIERQNVNIEF